MKLLNLTLAVIIFSLVTSFKKPPVKGPEPGTYGDCDCASGQKKAQVIVQLKLNTDHTFHYTDNSDPAHKVDMQGSWGIEKDDIVLKDYDQAHSIHKTWHIDSKNQKCIKSRKGMNFRRLCLVPPC